MKEKKANNGQTVINQTAFILNYQPHIEHQHNYTGGRFEEAEEEEAAAGGTEPAAGQRVKKCMEVLTKEVVLKNRYDHAWVMEAMNQTKDMPHFNSPASYISYMSSLGVKDLPSESTITKYLNKLTGTFPDWQFTDCDTTEATRRINVGRRFVNVWRKNDG